MGRSKNKFRTVTAPTKQQTTMSTTETQPVSQPSSVTTFKADPTPLNNEQKLARLKALLGGANQPMLGSQPDAIAETSQPNETSESSQSTEPTDPDKPLSNEEKLAKLKSLLSKTSTPVPQQMPQSTSQSGLPPMVEKVVNKGYHLFIGTPCYGGLCHVNYVVRLLQTQQLLAQLGIQCSIEFMKNESLITRGRNNMVAKFMVSPATHLLFIDADISWQPMDVVKLLAAEKDVVGGIYPKKRYAWERLTPEKIKDYTSRKNLFYNKDKSPEDLIRENLVNYNLNYDRKQMKIENNLLEIYTLATGFMCVKKEVFPKMFAAYPQSKYTDDVGYLQTPEENSNAYALFDCIIVQDHYFSEDWCFCHRWREIGGKIYSDVTINLDHEGSELFRGRLLSSLVIQ
jgi:hypothetical protein